MRWAARQNLQKMVGVTGWGDGLGLLVYQKSFIFAAICLCEASVTGSQPGVLKHVIRPLSWPSCGTCHKYVHVFLYLFLGYGMSHTLQCCSACAMQCTRSGSRYKLAVKQGPVTYE